MNGPNKTAWFPAKRYGFGWGFPNCWQGRVVMAAWLLLIIGGTAVLRPDLHPVAYAAYELFVTAILVLMIAAKGERPRWRWGDDADRKR